MLTVRMLGQEAGALSQMRWTGGDWGGGGGGGGRQEGVIDWRKPV